jgi:hypothetical protein
MPTYKYANRPVCMNLGCNNLAHCVQDYKNGTANYRWVCSSCHLHNLADNYGMALNEFNNRNHPYRKHRKKYCENIDGRLGYVCTVTIVWDGVLDVDHKNGDPSNNDLNNLQTLCKCCHAYKTNQSRDYLTPGRMALGLTGKTGTQNLEMRNE